MRIRTKTAALLGATALMAALGTTTAEAAAPQVLSPHICVHPAYTNNSSAEFITNTGSHPIWDGDSSECNKVGSINAGDEFYAWCYMYNGEQNEWIYGRDASQNPNVYGWIYAPNVVNANSGSLNKCPGLA